LVSCYLIP